MRTVKSKDLAGEVEKEFEALHRSLGFEIAARIIDNAPADTGQLKGSIIVSKNENNSGDTSLDPSGDRTKNTNRRNVMQANIKDDLYGVVNAEYGRAVDEGTSDTNPTGFFSSVVNNIKAVLDQAKRDSQRNRFKD